MRVLAELVLVRPVTAVWGEACVREVAKSATGQTILLETGTLLVPTAATARLQGHLHQHPAH